MERVTWTTAPPKTTSLIDVTTAPRKKLKTTVMMPHPFTKEESS